MSYYELNSNKYGAFSIERHVNNVEFDNNSVDNNSGNSAVKVISADYMAVNVNIFKNNASGLNYGGALSAHAGKLLVLNNVFDSNMCGIINGGGPSGGGASVNGDDVNVSNNTFVNNGSLITDDGGGLAVISYKSAIIANNVIAYNKARYAGGGVQITCYGGVCSFVNNTVYGNSTTSDSRAGGLSMDASTGTVLNIYNNAIVIIRIRQAFTIFM